MTQDPKFAVSAQCHTALVLWEETGTIHHAINTLRTLGWDTQQTWPRGPWQTKCPDCLKPWTPNQIDLTEKDTP